MEEENWDDEENIVERPKRKIKLSEDNTENYLSENDSEEERD